MDRKHTIGRTEKVRQLKELLLDRQIVYLSAYFYGGKTLLLEQLAARWQGKVTWLQPEEEMWPELASTDESKHLWILDDLQLVHNQSTYEAIAEWIGKPSENSYLILAGRAQLPAALRAYLLSGNITTLDRSFCEFTVEEMEQLFLSYQLSLKPDDLTWLKKASWGWTYAQHVVAQKLLKHPDRSVQVIWKEAFTELQKILVHDAIYGLPENERFFLYGLSPFPHFSEEMARMVTGRPDASKLLETLYENTHVLFSEQEGSYRFIPFVQQALYRELVSLHDDDYIRELNQRAALYYELTDQIPTAISFYIKLNNKEKIRELLIRDSQMRPSDGKFVALRNAYQQLSRESILASPYLMKGMCIIESLQGHTELSEEWYQELKKFASRTSSKDARKRTAEEILAYLDIVLPHRGTRHMLRTLIATARLNRWSGSESWENGFNVGGNSVSLMNGGLDFCRWAPHGEMLYRTLRVPIETALGKSGSGVADLALGECLLETNQSGDYSEAYRHVYQGLAQIKGDMELRCAGVGIQSHILAAQGNAEGAMDVMNHLILSLPEDAPPHLKKNLHAHQIWLQLLQGKTLEGQSWLESEAPDETDDFVILDRYTYMLKLRMYLITGRFKESQMLCAKLAHYFESYDRPYLRIQLHLLEAMIHRKTGKRDWQNEMSLAICLAKRYRLLRVIADEGIAIIDLLNEMELPNGAWEHSLLELVRKQAAAYPFYLKSIAQRPVFSERENQVYSLLLAGYSNAKIASVLRITERTVKYHTAAIYGKLGVHTRAEAMNRAAELGDIR